jgi:hypothetical protein
VGFEAQPADLAGCPDAADQAALVFAAQVPNPPQKGAQEVHRWIFVREIRKGSSWKLLPPK